MIAISALLALVAALAVVGLPVVYAHRNDRKDPWAGDAWTAEREHAPATVAVGASERGRQVA